jgi:hypothetical protein
LAKVIKIDKNKILISGVDMVNGTPILDIKPYHHLESLDLNKIKYPNWIKDVTQEEKKATVSFKDSAYEDLKIILEKQKLAFYDNFDEIIILVKELLEIDPHSKYTKKKQQTLLYAFNIDKLNIIYEYNAVKKEVIVHNIEFNEEYKKLRNKDWLEGYSDKFGSNNNN